MIIEIPSVLKQRRLPPPGRGHRGNGLQTLVLGLVWVSVASGAVVFTEPAPVDLLTILLVGLLPLVGLVSFKGGLVAYFAAWLLAAAAAFVASAFSNDIARSSIHSGISVYLYAASFVFAAFVARNPAKHAKLILNAYLWAAFIAAIAGIAGYFDLAPGFGELFTKFGRAAGTFKDPNVYGPFLIPALLYALHLFLNRPFVRTLVPAVLVMLLGIAILLSFSRGAWFSLAIAVAIYLYVSFVSSPTNRQRLKMMALGIVGLAMITASLAAVTQIDGVGRFLEERVQLTQNYDEGPEGRFGGQAKAQRLLLDNPFGLGAGVFTDVHHHEDVHNVYLSMFLNAGWLGGLVFIMMCAVTSIWGLRHAFRRTPYQAYFLIAYAAFVGNAVEGFVIDIDHWRHFYLLMALVWGMMLGDRHVATLKRLPRRPAKILGLARPRPPNRPRADRRHRPAPTGKARPAPQATAYDQAAGANAPRTQLAFQLSSGPRSVCMRAASSVLRRRQAIVIGPTPPGTGVIAPATAAASS